MLIFILFLIDLLLIVCTPFDLDSRFQSFSECCRLFEKFLLCIVIQDIENEGAKKGVVSSSTQLQFSAFYMNRPKKIRPIRLLLFSNEEPKSIIIDVACFNEGIVHCFRHVFHGFFFNQKKIG